MRRAAHEKLCDYFLLAVTETRQYSTAVECNTKQHEQARNEKNRAMRSKTIEHNTMHDFVRASHALACPFAWRRRMSVLRRARQLLLRDGGVRTAVPPHGGAR